MGFFSRGQIVFQETTVSAGGTDTLTATSLQVRYYTASATVKLPPTTSMVVGQQFQLYTSSGTTLTLEYQDATSFTPNPTLSPNSSLVATLVSTGTTNGTWTIQTGSGSGASSGSKNYLSAITTSNGINTGNGNFEQGSTNGWSLAHTALSSFIPTSTASAGNAFSSSSGGTAASGNLSFSAVSSGQLGGSYSGDLASSAASTAGDLLISNEFFIDTEDQAKMMQVTFSYKAVSGTFNFSGSTSNTFAVWAYDVTNGAWIMPQGVYNLVQGSGTGFCTATFQTTSNSTAYQLALININATSGAYTIYLDDFTVGPQHAPTGPAMTDDALTTLTFTGLGTVTSQVTYVGRIGDKARFRGYVTSGTTTASNLQITLPSGYTIDSTKLGSQSNASNVGVFYDLSSSTQGIYQSSGQAAVIIYDGSTTSSVFVARATSGGAFVKIAGNGLVTSNDPVAYEFTVPIAGWSSNTSVSSDTDTRVVDCVISTTATLSTTAGTAIAFPVVIADTHAAYNSSTGIYTVPVSGYYSVEMCGISGNSGNNNMVLVQNGTPYATIITASTTQIAGGSVDIKCNAGDTLAIYSASNNGLAFSTVTTTGGFKPVVSITRRSGPAVVTAAESVNMQYNFGGGTPGSGNVINFATKIFDSHNATTTGTGTPTTGWRYTAPVSGKYMVAVSTAQTAATATDYNVYKNGSQYAQLYTVNAANTSTSGSVLLPLNAGDYINIEVDSGVTISTNTVTNNISIYRVGN